MDASSTSTTSDRYFRRFPIPTISPPSVSKQYAQTHWIHVSTFAGEKANFVYNIHSLLDIFFQETFGGVQKHIITVSENPHNVNHRLFSDWDFEQHAVPMEERHTIIQHAINLYKSMSCGRKNLITQVTEELPVDIMLEVGFNRNVHLKTNICVSEETRKKCNRWIKQKLSEISPQYTLAFDDSSGLRMIFSGKHLKDGTIDPSSMYIPVDINYDFTEPPRMLLPDIDTYTTLCVKHSLFNLNGAIDLTEYDTIMRDLNITKEIMIPDGTFVEVDGEAAAPEFDYETPDGEIWRQIIAMAHSSMTAFSNPILSANDTILKYDRKHSAMCLICSRVHDSIGAYITYNKPTGSVRLHCFRNKDQFYILGYINPDDDLYELLGIMPERPTGLQSKIPQIVQPQIVQPQIVQQQAAPNTISSQLWFGKLPQTFKQYILSICNVINLGKYDFDTLSGREIYLVLKVGETCALCGKSCPQLVISTGEHTVSCANANIKI
jgi:hypothetical protein